MILNRVNRSLTNAISSLLLLLYISVRPVQHSCYKHTIHTLILSHHSVRLSLTILSRSHSDRLRPEDQTLRFTTQSGRSDPSLEQTGVTQTCYSRFIQWSLRLCHVFRTTADEQSQTDVTDGCEQGHVIMIRSLTAYRNKEKHSFNLTYMY